MQYLYFQDSGRLHVRTKALDAKLAEDYPNPIAVSDDYDITTNGAGAVEDGMPNKREKTRSEIEADLNYSEKRVAEYPSVVDQLDNIYHNGIDAWKVDIKAVKDAHPK